MSSKKIFIVLSLVIFTTCSSLLYYSMPDLDAHQEVDSEEYELIAREYVRTGYLAHPAYGMPVHTAGYYWLMGLVYKFISSHQAWVFFVQWFLSLVCFWLIYKTALLLFGLPVALVALFFISCNLGFMVFTQLILAEILLAVCLCGFLYAMALFSQSDNAKDLIVAALLLAASVMVKPVALFYGLVLPFFVWGVAGRTFKNHARMVLISLLFFYLPLTGYMTYNYYMFGNFAVTTLHTGNLYDYFFPRRIMPRLHGGERVEVQKYLDGSVDQKDHERRSSRMFFDLLKKYPMMYAAAVIEGMIKIFFGLYSTHLKVMFNRELLGGSLSFFAVQGSSILQKLYNYTKFGTDNIVLQLISLFEMCWLFLLYFLLCYALVSLLYKRNYFLILFWGSYVGYITLAAAFDGCGRYRMMLEPILVIGAAYAVIELYTVVTGYFVTKKRVVHA